MTSDAVVARFWDRVRKSGGCWIWTGTKTRRGYGQLMIGGRRVYAHRVAFELAHGPLPDGHLAIHRCDSPSCVRPDHLFVGSRADSVRNRADKGRTARGERQHLAKLTEAQVREVWALWARGGISMVEIGRRFGVTATCIRQILKGRTWRHVS